MIEKISNPTKEDQLYLKWFVALWSIVPICIICAEIIYLAVLPNISFDKNIVDFLETINEGLFSFIFYSLIPYLFIFHWYFKRSYTFKFEGIKKYHYQDLMVYFLISSLFPLILALFLFIYYNTNFLQNYSFASYAVQFLREDHLSTLRYISIPYIVSLMYFIFQTEIRMIRSTKRRKLLYKLIFLFLFISLILLLNFRVKI